MNKKLGMNDFEKSQFAIKDYIDYKEENCYMHRARVLISSNGKLLFNDILQVEAVIDTNYSLVNFVSTEQFERDFFIQYTNEYQRFEFIRGTLLIQAKDRWGNDIQINITGL